MDNHNYVKLSENLSENLSEGSQKGTSHNDFKTIKPLNTDDFTIEISNNKSISVNNENLNKNEDYAVILRNIHKTYLIGIEGVPALRGVSLKVKKGEFLIILGTSGGGKTSLLNIIGTIDTPSRGDLKIFDKIIRSKTNDDILSAIRTDQVAFVFQSFNLLPSMNVLENVEIPMKIRGELNSEQIKKRAIELLEMVGLSTRLYHFPNQLSGGEQQRVTIARALSNNPKILLLDEPTGDLDTKNSDIVMDILLDLNIKENITMIMVTHDVALKNYGNRVVRVVDGKITHEYLIDEAVRKDNIKELKERSANKSIGLREGVSTNTNNKENIKNFQSSDSSSESDIDKSNNISENFNPTSKTFFRKVTDYKIKKFSNIIK